MGEHDYLTYQEASDYLKVPLKYLENYIRAGKEIPSIRYGRRKLIPKSEVDKWKVQREFLSIFLDKDDYLKCFDFALKSFYHYKSTSDFGTSTQRDAGKFLTNFVSGKLGEIAVEKFLIKHFNVRIRLDFSIRNAIVGQDISEVAIPRKGPLVFNPPRIRISIKTTKMKNVWLVVPVNELEDPIRCSDIYILSRVDLF